MRTQPLGSITAVAVALLLIAAAPLAAQETDGWICAPCGHAEDDTIYDEPGDCPHCGMELIPVKEAKAMEEARLQVAILIFDGVQIIDFTAPYEVFGQLPYNVFTVGPTSGTVTTAMKMSVNPTYNIDESPEPDILIVPGGHVHDVYADERVMSWVKSSSEKADHVLSVCNGAFILAQAGLLDGKSATTFYGLIEELKRFRPAVNVVSDQRFVDNGKIVTSAGLSSGLDASLFLVSKLRGQEAAEALALHLEYFWDPEGGFVRAALADMRLPDIEMPDDVTMTLLASDGDRDEWEVTYRAETSRSASELLAQVGKELKENAWSPAAEVDQVAQGDGGARSRWRFSDAEGRAWEGELALVPEKAESFLSTLRIRRTAAGGSAAGR